MPYHKRRSTFVLKRTVFCIDTLIPARNQF